MSTKLLSRSVLMSQSTVTVAQVNCTIKRDYIQIIVYFHHYLFHKFIFYKRNEKKLNKKVLIKSNLHITLREHK